MSNQIKAAIAGSLALVAFPLAAQDAKAPVPGVIAAPPPVDLTMEVTTGPKGEPVLSETEFELVTGGYYRFNFVCPDARDDATGFHLEVNKLLENAHLRVVSIGDIEVYMQGLSFRAIECDEAGSARFSFHPMRTGVYDIYVRDHSDPPQEAFGKFIVE